MMDLSFWSAAISDDKLLNQITMPGSHDATIYSGDDFKTTGLFGSSSSCVTQSGTILDQCMLGSRFYDVRLKQAGGSIRGYHQFLGQGGLGASAQQILDDVNTFLSRRGSEFVFLRISHTSAKTGIVDFVKNHPIEQKLYKGTGNLAKTRIGDLRGSAICIFAQKEFGARQTEGIHDFIKFKSGANYDTGLSTCGFFEKKKSIKEVIVNGLTGASDHAGHADDHLFFLYWQRTYGNVRDNTYEKKKTGLRKPKLTGGTHENTGYMIKLLSGHDPEYGESYDVKVGKKHNKTKKFREVKTTWGDRRVLPNIISYDFINQETSQEIVEVNDPGVIGFACHSSELDWE